MTMFDLTKEMSVPPQLIGLEQLLMPAQAHVSSQRAVMWGSHAAQAIVLDNAEFPTWFTGFEAAIGRYPFRSAEIKESAIVKAVLSKFGKIGTTSPQTLVIYVGSETHEIGYFAVDQYVHLSKEFGYRARWKNTNLWFADTPIEKGTEFEEAINYDGPMYSMGVNANVAYITAPETTADAFGVSEDFVRRLSHTRVGTISVTIPEDALPLNLYGDGITYKIMPGLNETVNEQGILIGVRNVASDCFMSDVNDASLHIPQPINDQLYRLPAGTRVVDIDVYLGSKFGKQACGSTMYEQLLDYNEQLTSFYTRIVETYFTLLEQGYTASHKFNTLVTHAISMLGMESKRSGKLQFKGPAYKQMMRILGDRGRRELRLFNKKTPIDFAMVTIKYAYTGTVGLGSKITGRDGAKGVIARIIPTEQMPVDAYGVRADIVACPTGAFNRLNPSQFYEQYINRVAYFVRKHALSLSDTKAGYEYVLNFFRMLSPTYAAIVESQVTNKAAMEQFMLDLERRGIHYVIPPFTTNRLKDLIPKLKAVYHVDKTPVEFDIPKRDGSLEHIRTRNPIMIGSKYVVVLGKIPGDDLTAQEASFVNQHQLPVKIHGSLKDMQSVGRTPIRIGEDETMLTTMSVGPEVIVRLLGVHATSSAAFLKLAQSLLTADKPTQLRSVPGLQFQEIVQTSANVAMLHHSLGAVGIRITTPVPTNP